ncbi:hypothetical protein MuYL_2331 [Mucilaginibacter xinganensis]|uniref:Uncharacterized protein n=1 Tax=Mucilaginibacter xinganensis TaxID=1234841 RepID=A0A223NWQ3_9SPHI|nr:hypothetical protein MuYL_2331 [Mucilaginibacter xinganensis]
MGNEVKPNIPSITIMTDITVESTGRSMNLRNITLVNVK